jgi:hypothetical protein
MEQLDKEIRPLYDSGLGCRRIGHLLQENPVIILRRVRKMGIKRNKEEAREIIPNNINVFQNKQNNRNIRRSAIVRSIGWFMDRGYMVSLPVDPARYDLIAESDSGLKRIQIKTTTHRSPEGNWVCRLTTLSYDKNAKIGSAGKRKRRTYTADEIDIFFIETGDGDIYIIPIDLAEGATSLTLDKKYKQFKAN